MEVYAFEWCDCVYESVFGVESLHATKASAYKAMRSRLIKECWDERDAAIQCGHLYGKGGKPLSGQSWRIRTIEVIQ